MTISALVEFIMNVFSLFRKPLWMIANRIRIYEFCIIELYIKVLRKPQASSFRNSINSQNLDKVSGKKDV